MDVRREKTPLEWEVDELRAENSRLRTFLGQNRMVDTRQQQLIDILKKDRDRLRAAGDALAAAAGFVANRGQSEGWRGKMIDRLDSALAAWDAARGGGEAEATQKEGDDR